MSDIIDMAQDIEERERFMALSRMRERIDASFTPRPPGLERLCMDCDDPIEPERFAALAGKTSRCASCARDYERRLRMRRTGP